MIELSHNELILLDSVLAPTAFIEGPEAYPDKPLCLKIGSALLEAEHHEPVPIAFGVQELWILRERVNIFAAVGSDAQVGLVLKRKLYRDLLAVENRLPELEGPSASEAEYADKNDTADRTADDTGTPPAVES